MAQIQAGQTYQTGMAVTAANLNAHVNNASLLPGCIAEQVVAPSVSSTDSILISNGSSLNKTTHPAASWLCRQERKSPLRLDRQ